jgi:hypothetical protein
VHRWAPEAIGAVIGAGLVVALVHRRARSEIAAQVVRGLTEIDERTDADRDGALAILGPRARLAVNTQIKDALASRGMRVDTARTLVQDATRVHAALYELGKVLR